MSRPPPVSTRTDTLFPYTTLFRSVRRIHSTTALVPGSSNESTRYNHSLPIRWQVVRPARHVRCSWPLRYVCFLLVHSVNYDRKVSVGDRKSTRLNSSH